MQSSLINLKQLGALFSVLTNVQRISIEQRSKPLWHSMTSWLVRDGRDGILLFDGLLRSPCNWVGFHPQRTANNQGQVVTAQLNILTPSPLETSIVACFCEPAYCSLSSMGTEAIKIYNGQTIYRLHQKQFSLNSYLPTWSLTVRPWNVTFPKGKGRLPLPSFFRGELLNFVVRVYSDFTSWHPLGKSKGKPKYHTPPY